MDSADIETKSSEYKCRHCGRFNHVFTQMVTCPVGDYTRTDLYTAAIAERDKLRELCREMAADMNKAKRMIGGFTYDAQNPAQKEASVNQAWHVLDDAVSQYEKHKAGQ